MADIDTTTSLSPFGYIKNSYNSFSTGDYANGFENLFNGIFSPIGSGDKAQSLGQMGLGLFGALQQQKAFNAQLAEARRQFEFSKGMSQANFMNQGTNYLNQGLFQLESLNAFNPNAGAERAANLNAAVNQLNQAGSKIGLGSNAFQSQADALAKYNTLKPTVGQ